MRSNRSPDPSRSSPSPRGTSRWRSCASPPGAPRLRRSAAPASVGSRGIVRSELRFDDITDQFARFHCEYFSPWYGNLLASTTEAGTPCLIVRSRDHHLSTLSTSSSAQSRFEPLFPSCIALCWPRSFLHPGYNEVIFSSGRAIGTPAAEGLPLLARRYRFPCTSCGVVRRHGNGRPVRVSPVIPTVVAAAHCVTCVRTTERHARPRPFRTGELRCGWRSSRRSGRSAYWPPC